MCTSTPRALCPLPATHAAPRIGRDFLASASCPAHPLSSADDVALLASEAITNAVVHGRPPLSLAYECLTSSVEVRVRDAGDRMPEGRQPTAASEGGRGMLLVEGLSEAWGVDADGEGKEIWFRVAL